MVPVLGTFLLPILRRCGEDCEAWLILIAWGSVETALLLTGIGSMFVGLRRLFQLVRVIRSRQRTIAQLTERHFGRTVELFGRATNETPRRGPLSEELVAAYLLEIRGEWQRSSGERKESKTTERQEQFLDGLTLDDGTGKVHISIGETLRYWPKRYAEWPGSEAPSWAAPPPPKDENSKLVRVAASEQFLPVGTDLYVIGRFTAPGIVKAQVASATTEGKTRRALTAEWLSSWVVAGVSLLLAVQFIDPVLRAWQSYWVRWSGSWIVLGGFTFTIAIIFILLVSILACFFILGLIREIGESFLKA